MTIPPAAIWITGLGAAVTFAVMAFVLKGAVVQKAPDVIQPNAAWAEAHLDDLVAAAMAVTGATVVIKNAGGRARGLEGLDDVTSVLVGEEDGPIPVQMNGATYMADVLGGQKTGLFFDQRDTVSSVVAASKEAGSADDFTTKMVKVCSDNFATCLFCVGWKLEFSFVVSIPLHVMAPERGANATANSPQPMHILRRLVSSIFLSAGAVGAQDWRRRKGKARRRQFRRHDHFVLGRPQPVCVGVGILQPCRPLRCPRGETLPSCPHRR